MATLLALIKTIYTQRTNGIGKLICPSLCSAGRQAGGRMRMRVRSPRKINGNRQQAGRQKEQAKTTTATRTVQSSLSLSPGPHKYRHAFADRIKIVALVFNARTRRYRSSHSSRRSSSSSHSTLFRNWLPGLLDSRRRWARGLRLKWQPGTVVS